MRVRTLILAATLACSPALFATDTITQAQLDDTLLKAQQSIEAREYDQAFELYSQAAHWGHKGAQYVLGEMYLRGEGTQQNDVLGLAWLDAAAESRNRDFVRARNKAEDQLNAADIEKAEKVAEQNISAYGIEATGMTCKKEMRVGSNIKVVNCYHKRGKGDTIYVPEYKGDFQLAAS